MKSLIKALVIFGILLLLQLVYSGEVLAQTKFTGLQSLAMGGAGRAAVDADSTSFLNPASAAHMSGYHIGSAYRIHAPGPGQTGNDFVVDAAENQPDTMFPLVATFMKTSDTQLDSTEVDKREIHFTTAQLVGKNFSVGLDAAQYSLSTPAANEDHWDYKLGAMYVPAPNLGFGLVLSDLKTTDFTFLNRNIELGMNYLFQDFFRFAGDIIYPIQNNPDQSSIVMLGFEHMFSDQFPIRAGYRYDGTLAKSYVSAGFGWNGPKVGLNYAFEKNFSQGHDYGHSVDIKLYF